MYTLKFCYVDDFNLLITERLKFNKIAWENINTVKSNIMLLDRSMGYKIIANVEKVNYLLWKSI